MESSVRLEHRGGEKMADYIVRATAAGAQIRAFACTTRELVEQARQAHNTSPVVTAALGRLLSAGAMMGTMLKGEEDLLTLQMKGDGPMQGLLVTADARGNVKGYAYTPDVIIPANSLGKLDVAGALGKGTLRVIRDMGLKEPYVGADFVTDQRNCGGSDLLFCHFRTSTLIRGLGCTDGAG